MESVDVVIPVYNPDKSFFTLIDKLENQTIRINQIILMNTEQKYLDRLTYGTHFYEKYHNISVNHLSKKEFDHGNTRNKAVKKSESEIFVMMTQDAIPADEYLIANLIRPLQDKSVAAAYARQIPAEDSSYAERFARAFNYPAENRIKSKKDMAELGIKTYFCSNVCAAYNREVFNSLEGFVKRAIFNEDMIYAAKAINAGYKIAYAADAAVIHSHNYSFLKQFHRNFDIGVSQAEHPEVFSEISSEGEGISLIKKTTKWLWKEKKKTQIPGLLVNSIFKYAGFLLGKKYRILPRFLIFKFTMNKNYWK